MKRANGGRISALVMTVGLWFCLSATAHANDEPTTDTNTASVEQPAEAEPGKPIALNKYSKRKRTAKVARVQKPRVVARGYRRKAIDADAVPNAVPMVEPEQAAISDNVANANAQWPTPDTSIQAVAATPPANGTASNGVVAADQLNELDRNIAAPANGEDAASQIATKMASQLAQNSSQAAGVNVPTTATPAMSAMASTEKPQVVINDDNAWSQSSLIGKIFIAFGGLLTVASAARMFMA